MQTKLSPEWSAHLLSPLRLHSWAPGSSPVQNTNLGEHLETDAHQAHPCSSQALSSVLLFSSSECLSTSLLNTFTFAASAAAPGSLFSILITCPLSQPCWAGSLDHSPPTAGRNWFSFSPSHMFFHGLHPEIIPTLSYPS